MALEDAKRHLIQFCRLHGIPAGKVQGRTLSLPDAIDRLRGARIATRVEGEALKEAVAVRNDEVHGEPAAADAEMIAAINAIGAMCSSGAYKTVPTNRKPLPEPETAITAGSGRSGAKPKAIKLLPPTVLGSIAYQSPKPVRAFAIGDDLRLLALLLHDEVRVVRIAQRDVEYTIDMLVPATVVGLWDDETVAYGSITIAQMRGAWSTPRRVIETATNEPIRAYARAGDVRYILLDDRVIRYREAGSFAFDLKNSARPTVMAADTRGAVVGFADGRVAWCPNVSPANATVSTLRVHETAIRAIRTLDYAIVAISATGNVAKVSLFHFPRIETTFDAPGAVWCLDSTPRESFVVCARNEALLVHKYTKASGLRYSFATLGVEGESRLGTAVQFQQSSQSDAALCILVRRAEQSDRIVIWRDLLTELRTRGSGDG